MLHRFRLSIANFSQADKIHQLDICVDPVGRASLTVHFSGTDSVGLRTALKGVGSAEKLTMQIETGDAKRTTVSQGPLQMMTPEEDNILQLGFPPGGFIQINLRQNKSLVSEVLKGAIQSGRERVLDLYAGIGNFSLPLARNCVEVVGVEEYKPGVQAAIRNALSHNLDNVRFIAGRSERVIAQMVGGQRFETVVLDPPRSGAAPVVKSLLQLQPDRIVYVSCDPSTLARDLLLFKNGGYRLLSARPIDMFPQTWHIEGIAVLVRSDNR